LTCGLTAKIRLLTIFAHFKNKHARLIADLFPA
jgi:hypothetical protein